MYFTLTRAGIDYIGYATGQTDKFQGTGVFSGIKMERTLPPVEPVANAPKEKEPAATTANTVEKKYSFLCFAVRSDFLQNLTRQRKNATE